LSLLVGLLLLLSVLVLCASMGAVAVPLPTSFTIVWNHLFGWLKSLPVNYTPGQESVIWNIRLPRVLVAGLVGAGLATGGATYQGLFRNSLADPYLIGVAQGASTGAVLALVAGLPAVLYSLGVVQWAAFGGAVLTVGLVYMLARMNRIVPTTTLLLAGVAVGSLAASVTSLLIYLNGQRLAQIYGWLLGGFNASNWDQVWSILPYIGLGSGLLYFFGRQLNVLQMGEEPAIQLGLQVERLKVVMVLAATLITAAAVSVSGIIGFVGLVVPHIVRLLIGHDYRTLLPLSTLYGAIFMICADACSRTLLAPVELPVGILTAFCGAPFFIFLLRRNKRMVL
jgi:iron complex transport system permease protein